MIKNYFKCLKWNKLDLRELQQQLLKIAVIETELNNSYYKHVNVPKLYI